MVYFITLQIQLQQQRRALSSALDALPAGFFGLTIYLAPPAVMLPIIAAVIITSACLQHAL